MAIKSSQKEKLRALLEKISTPEEMKAFDAELSSKNTEKSTNKLIDAIKQNKTEINWSFIEKLINKTKESLSEKIDEIKQEFSNKKYPTYDDSEIQKKLDLILKDSKDDKFVKDATQKSQGQVLDELITIGDLLVSIRDISGNPKENSSESFLMINKSLEGIGGLLQKILSFTGSNDSTRLASGSNIVGKVGLVDDSGDVITDDLDDTIVSMENEHHKVHIGMLFQIDLYSTVTNGTPSYCQFKTGAKTVHLKQKEISNGTDTLLCTFIEAPTLTNGTTPVTIINRNRTSANTSTVTVYSDPTGVSGGTILDYNYLSGTKQSSGYPVNTTIEWNLKPNTNYIQKLECLTSGTATFLGKLLWYEI